MNLECNRMWEAMAERGTVRVCVRVSVRGGVYLPDPDGDKEERAIFKVLTFGDNMAIENMLAKYVPVMEGHKDTVKVVDPFEFRRIVLRKNLLWWSLPIPIEREGGWITEESWARVGSIPAPLMQEFSDCYERHFSISEDEEQCIEKQASILFSRNSKGVVDACEAVSLFCILGNYWERFGITRGTPIEDMPFKEYLLLKIMDGKASESMRRVTEQSKHSGVRGRVAGARGTRASRGVVIRE